MRKPPRRGDANVYFTSLELGSQSSSEEGCFEAGGGGGRIQLDIGKVESSELLAAAAAAANDENGVLGNGEVHA